MLKLARNARYSFLLESVEGGAVRGRYSIIGMNPDLIWKVEGKRPSINRKAMADPDGLSSRCRSSPRLRRSAHCSPKAGSNCPRTRRPWRRACSAISAMTWCGSWRSCRSQILIRSAFPTAC